MGEVSSDWCVGDCGSFEWHTLSLSLIEILACKELQFHVRAISSSMKSFSCIKMQGNVASRFLIYVVSLIDFSLLWEEVRKRRMKIYQGTFVKNVLDIFFCFLFCINKAARRDGWYVLCTCVTRIFIPWAIKIETANVQSAKSNSDLARGVNLNSGWWKVISFPRLWSYLIAYKRTRSCCIKDITKL